jgi:hypothetical protein
LLLFSLPIIVTTECYHPLSVIAMTNAISQGYLGLIQIIIYLEASTKKPFCYFYLLENINLKTIQIQGSNPAQSQTTKRDPMPG